MGEEEANKPSSPQKKSAAETAQIHTEQQASPSALDKNIIRQMEYYFGDINLARDAFLLEKTSEDNGWVTFETLLTFNRLKRLSEDVGVIKSALEKSKSGLLEISEDGLKVRRNPDRPLPQNTEERRVDLKSRTLYLKGFPEEYTMDNLIEFFDAQTDQVEAVQMRRRREEDHKFKGSVFLVLKNKEAAKDLLNRTDLKCGEETLIIKTKEAYFKDKSEEKKGAKLQIGAKDGEKADESKEDENPVLVKNAILHVDGVAHDIFREQIKESFNDYSTVAWIDFNRGDTEAWVRFDEENGADVALEKATEKSKTDGDEGKIRIKGTEVHCHVLKGDAEFAHWKAAAKQRAELRAKKQASKRGRGGRGGRDGRRERRRGGRRKESAEGDMDVSIDSMESSSAETSPTKQQPTKRPASATEDTSPAQKQEDKDQGEPEVKQAKLESPTQTSPQAGTAPGNQTSPTKHASPAKQTSPAKHLAPTANVCTNGIAEDTEPAAAEGVSPKKLPVEAVSEASKPQEQAHETVTEQNS